MDKLVEKISSYHLLNFIISGAIFVLFFNKFFEISINDFDIIEKLILFYFVGLVISRIGSIVLEPLFIKWKIVTYAPSKDYIFAEKKDDKLIVLLEMNNLFRTMMTMLFLLLLCFAGRHICRYISITKEVIVVLTLCILFVLFVLSYRKQTGAIRKRVECAKEKEKISNKKKDIIIRFIKMNKLTVEDIANGLNVPEDVIIEIEREIDRDKKNK